MIKHKLFKFLFLFLFFYQNLESIPVTEFISDCDPKKTYYKDESLGRFLGEIQTFVEFSKSRMSPINKWINDNGPAEDWFDIDSWSVDINQNTNKFMPFVEKLIVEPGSKVAFFGDLHGNCKALLDYLHELNELEYLDENYKICKDNFYMIFLGDYIDRAPLFESFYTVELLVNLCNQNPGKVFLLRGNHDDLSCHRAIRNGAFSQKYEQYQKVFSLFDYLPVALYLGCSGEDGVTNFLQCCHAGIEFGFDPKKILGKDDKNFQKVFPLARESILYLLNVDMYANEDLEKYSKIIQIKSINRGLGFCLNYFNDDQASLVKSYLKFVSSDSKILRGLMRGHQHHGKTWEVLIDNIGFVQSWNGLVYTILSTFFPHDPVGKEFSQYRSFVILNTAENCKDWTLEHYYNTDAKVNFNLNVFHYF